MSRRIREYALLRSLAVPPTTLSLYSSAQDVNNALIDDGLVDKAKIAGANFFWSFPAKKDRLLQIQHHERLSNITKLKARVEEATLQLQDAKRGREEDENNSRATKLQKLKDMAQETLQLQAQLDQLRENDPQALADLEKELQLCTEAANRWTDNIFNCQSYLVKKRGMDKKQVQKILGITSAFDCECLSGSTNWGFTFVSHKSLFSFRCSPFAFAQIPRTRSPSNCRLVWLDNDLFFGAYSLSHIYNCILEQTVSSSLLDQSHYFALVLKKPF